MNATPVADEHETDDFQVVTHTLDGVSLVRLIGDVDLSVAARLRTTFETALAAHPWVIVDLTRAGAVDSIGLGVLVAAAQVARRRSGDVLLAGAPPFFTAVLHAARLGAVFTTFATVPQAMTAALAGTSAPH
ncbi:STAS domain-containing protein [Actinoplanes awajinensis]|uniref:STAS domain-containing protein n=1 Tax=Actinoplanes awajinensis subsp. mycoplanecinus TaxID=135947 RepID=A0A101JQV3_9ACTN|nr:STAS domain-containing protein [Actinoplanes awajinensis]KUL30756.1 hypothetical protein ADL15_24225 [Actinoplanes awajinensis subsp. mycoplanecinus]